MPKLIPNLWFDNNAQEAVDFYLSIFKNGKINKTLKYTKTSAQVAGMTEGDVLAVYFTINDMEIVIINGGPAFKLTEAFSLMIECETQEEIDYYWELLTADGGQEGPCGWLKDKFGVSWQVSPKMLDEMFTDKNAEKVDRTFACMNSMTKLNIAELEKAYNR